MCVLLLAPLIGEERPLPDLSAFAARVKTTLATDDARQSGYVYNERTITEKLDGAGRVLHRSERVVEVYPNIPGDPAYRRLIEEDGHPLSSRRLADEDRKRQRAVDAYAKTLSTSAGRQHDAEVREKERREDAAAIDDIFRVYTITLIGRETIDGHDTIVATLTPRARASAQTADGKMMQHFAVRAWINEADAEIVRVDVDALDDLTFGWGVFARVHKGAHATYERRQLNDDVWLPAAVRWSGDARVLLVKHLRERSTSTFFDYRRYTVGTSTTFTAGTH